MGHKLTYHSAHYQPPKGQGIPDRLILWQDQNSGITALTQAADDILDGKIVAFALCTHEPHQDPVIDHIVKIGMSRRDKSIRFCGGDDGENPDGYNSHALIPDYYGMAKDRAAIAVAMALHFRQWKYVRLNQPQRKRR